MVAGHADVARRYYETIDEGDYEDLASLLAASFVHERPDVTLEGRERFVSFMRDERPMMDTTHVVDGIFTDDGGHVAVRGRLLREGEALFGFVDVFSIDDGDVTRIDTFTR